MAQAKSFFDDVKKEIECPVCQEQFGANKQPKILKCLHTFCKSCLDGWLRQHRTGALSCPTCRTVTECPNNDIDSLPSNLFYKQMVEIVEAYTGQEESSCCGKCDEQKSLRFYCSNCNCLLCEECAALHKKWKDFRGHQIKEIGQLQSSDVEDYSRRTNVCTEHDDEFRFFCDACQICICRDCAILDHDDHKKISLEKGLENKTTEIENKIREVQVNGSQLRNKKESLEKRRIKVMNSFERATNSVRMVAEQWITFIRKHEADITEKLMKQKDAFEAEFSNQMSSLDGRVVEIESSIHFGEVILSRRNLPEILNVEEMLENRLQELSVPFESTLVFPEVAYSSNDFSCLKDGPGRLIRTVTEPTVSVAEGRGLNEAIEGEESTFTVITKDIRGQIVCSEIDQVNVDIISISTKAILTASLTDFKNGRYQVKYRSETADDFQISVTVRGEAIEDSPFRLRVRKRETQTFYQWKPLGDLRNDGERAIDANPSEFARVTLSKDVLEANLGRVKVSVSRGDLTTEKVDAIVNASNETLRHDSGLAKAILDKGGKLISQESNKIIKKRRSLKEGQAVSTKSGDLPCKLVVHAVGPEYRRIGLTQSKEVLRRACLNSLRIAQEEKLTSIALPAIGSGTNGMPKDACAEVMFDVVDEFIRQGDPKKKTITDVRFVDMDDASFQAFRKGFISRYGHTGDDGRGSFHSSPTGAEGTDLYTQTYRRNRGRNTDKSSEANGALAKSRDVSGSRNFPETNFYHPLDATASGGSSLPNLSYSGAVKKSTDFNSEEKEMGFSLPPGENKAQTDDKEDDPCPICLDTLTKPRKLKCRHTFCSDCLKQALNASNKCPVCQERQGVLQGNQPPGEMRYRVDRFSVPGYEGHDTIVIDYLFKSGIQGKEHPHPGQRFGGTIRQAYLPDTREGREVLQLLRRAFDARLVFTIGTSTTTGLPNQITWNDIHHKTSLSGGTFAFGYPDSDYLRRVKEELAVKGIR